MRDLILAKLGESANNFFRQKPIDGRHSKRRLPGPLGKNCQRSPARKVTRPDQDHSRRNFYLSIDFTCDTARILVSRMGNKACARADFSFLAAARNKGIDVSAQARGIIRIKPAGDSRRANHGQPGGLLRLGRFALDIDSDIFAAFVPDLDFVTVLITAGVQNAKHFGADCGGISESMQLERV